MNSQLTSSLNTIIKSIRLTLDDKRAQRIQSEQIRQTRIEHSPQFMNGRVKSNIPSVETDDSFFGLLWKFFSTRSQYKPKHALPYQAVDTNKLQSRSQALRVTWLGHSSLFIEVDKQRILIDPVFEYAAPRFSSRLFKRNVAAPVSKEALSLPDVILISHNHYDHLEESTVRYYASKNVMFYVPLGVGRYLEKWGINPDSIQEFDWWEEQVLNGVQIMATPANHNSARGLFDGNKTLWASWVIKAESGSVFYSGDTAYGAHFKAIGDKLGPFDLTFMEVAANVKGGKRFPVEAWGHMQASHTMQAHLDVQGDKLFPVHWSTYELFMHQWDEPVNDLIGEAQKTSIELVTPFIGQSVDFSKPISSHYWWQESSKVQNEIDDSLCLIKAR
ncbi:MBL fold metallo-hydrolase [Vibrio neonatus]|uniref:MBL fold metallo-hydrolase n=1 Tax=Vibrio neonatus TaxID=278860 RepID=UPI0021C313B4|nr:MBL fold metallo-hydrolase [Vibrio neonatus]